MSKQKGLVPPLRFPEFRDAEPWEVKRLGDVVNVVRGGSPRPISQYLTKDDGLNWLKIGDIQNEEKYVFLTEEKIKRTGLSKTREVNPGDLILSNSMSFGRPYIMGIHACIHDGWLALTNLKSKSFSEYLYYFILSDSAQKYLHDAAAGGGVRNLNVDIVKLLPIAIPSYTKEQKKIADCLSSLDDLIQAEEKALEALKKHKKGLMQQLFPAPGETTPKLRFPEFRDAGPWELKELGDALDYQQPGPFIVSSDQYKKNGIPVLTAGKTFILGYTTEDYGIYESVPVIIFDDFTTESKFVDFPFKVKSSAIKILTARPGYSIKFVYEAMSLIKFNATQHKRYWISEYQHLKIPFPKLEEQQKIADCLSSLDDLILTKSKRVNALKRHKKGLLQNLFPREIK